jgi:hypothetical protein
MISRQLNYRQCIPLMKFLCFISWLIVLVSVGGCASVGALFKPTPFGPKFQLDKNENSAYANIYLYRPWRSGSGFATPMLTINGEEVGPLRNGAYTKINAAEGKYILETHHAARWVRGPEDHIVIHPEQKQTYFIRILPQTAMDSTYFEFSMFNEQDALTEISDTYYVSPKKELFQYDRNYNIVCKANGQPVECKNETKNLKDRSGPGTFILELVILTGLMVLAY